MADRPNSSGHDPTDSPGDLHGEGNTVGESSSSRPATTIYSEVDVTEFVSEFCQSVEEALFDNSVSDMPSQPAASITDVGNMSLNPESSAYNHEPEYISKQLGLLSIEEEAYNARRVGAGLPKAVMTNDWGNRVADWSIKKTSNRRVECLVKAYDNVLAVQKVVNFIRPSEADQLLDQLEQKKAKALGTQYQPTPRPPLESDKPTKGKNKLNPFYKFHFADDMKDQPVEDDEEELKTEPWVDHNFPPTEDPKMGKFEREDLYKYHGIEVKKGGKLPEIVKRPDQENPMKYAPVPPPTFTKKELEQAQDEERLPVFFYGSYQFPDICSRSAQIEYPKKFAGNYTPARLNEYVSLAVTDFHMPAAVPVPNRKARRALQQNIGEILDVDDQQNVKGFKELHEHLGENEQDHKDKAAPRQLLNVKGMLVFGLTKQQKALLDKQFRLMYKKEIVEVDFYVKLPPPELVRVETGVLARATAHLKNFLRPAKGPKPPLPSHPALRDDTPRASMEGSGQPSMDKGKSPAAHEDDEDATKGRKSSEKSGTVRLGLGLRKISGAFARTRKGSGEGSSVASSRAATPVASEEAEAPVSFPANPAVRPPKRRSGAPTPLPDDSDSDVTVTPRLAGPQHAAPARPTKEDWAPGAEVLVRTRAHVWVYNWRPEELIGPSTKAGWDWEDRLGEAMKAGGWRIPGYTVKEHVF